MGSHGMQGCPLQYLVLQDLSPPLLQRLAHRVEAEVGHRDVHGEHRLQEARKGRQDGSKARTPHGRADLVSSPMGRVVVDLRINNLEAHSTHYLQFQTSKPELR